MTSEFLRSVDEVLSKPDEVGLIHVRHAEPTLLLREVVCDEVPDFLTEGGDLGRVSEFHVESPSAHLSDDTYRFKGRA